MIKWHLTPLVVTLAGALTAGLTGCQSNPATINDAPKSHSLSGVLTAYGYTVLEPPSTLIPPGTIVTVQTANPLVVGIVCGEASALSTNAPITLSEGASSTITQSASGTFDLGVDVVNRVNAEVGGTYVQSISVSLTHVQVLEIADDAVVQFASQRSAACKTAIDLRRQGGEKLTMIKSVLKADATYNITFNATLKTDVKAQILPTIAANLNATAGAGSNGTLTGTGLYWGVRDNSVLLDWPKPVTKPVAPLVSAQSYHLASRGLASVEVAHAATLKIPIEMPTTAGTEAPLRPVLQPGAVVSKVSPQ